MQTLESGRRSTRVEALKRDIESHVRYTLARDNASATERDVYMATAWTLRDRLADRWAATNARYEHRDVKRVYYLSLEFLIGRALGNALINLGLDGATAEALEELGYNLEELMDREPDAGLGNGGLGRLAACYLDSMATLELPGMGYGIRYEHGIFRQALDDQGRQVEKPDNWLMDGNPWEIARPDRTYKVKFWGRVQAHHDEEGRVHFDWVDTSDVLAMAYDTPVPGYCNNTVNTLRLWAAKATEEFDLEGFIRGNYIAAVEAKTQTETISKVLYPPDDTGAGKELRLKQQYFFVSATLQDIIARYLTERKTFDDFPDKVQIQLNDTHPAVAIPELMRLLMDDHGLEWDESFDLARRTFAYTNHTVLPEALEQWGTDLFGRLLPRQMEIVREIDKRFRARVLEKFPGDAAREERMAIVSGNRLRMANLAIVGSHTTNGVAALHTEILKDSIFKDFHELWPDRFTSVTNGITQRRWMLKANPRLSSLITEAIGDEWVTQLERLRELEPLADDAAFRERWMQIKAGNRARLAGIVTDLTGTPVDPASMMDVQIKRMHEYKRQLMNVLRCVDSFLMLRDTPDLDVPARAVLFGGKAAPTYWTAKLIIQLTNAVGRLVNAEPKASRLLRVAFLPDYRVSLAEKIFPGSDLSEQISTAGYEASGTGNMKFALNGALTIGTLDGANVEIAENVGDENIFIFGLKADEVEARKAAGYNPRAEYEASPRLRRVLDFILSGVLSPENPGLYRPLVEGLLFSDPYMVLADFDAYVEAQEQVDFAWGDQQDWTRKAILNVARSGFFSSDRSVKEYATRIWHL
ncbi:glycogen/starch/alpha-glucan phosphorylase [Longimicrobium terrae]|uniref:Alpha-1,4 glucan phosphorylase n=1 Tax=Longimicrobium terrae TaxID=1639882 RepID=A0A841GRS3_9BACT|nr:glycogen/starch/alpha-glucan phosphorylase [Longimicrobium terrae]MBB4634121.1 starch phosphorylase [Longimicrobium terrae]MBB6068989.1 starch phosphorylase [Longimicrobium terrae]NNC28167.1 glycogen/starch/alpha-glucan phosphorylase [Longimicrobium terrae]